MNISWSSRDAFNANVVDNASGQVLFHINTPFKLFGKRVTTIADAQGQLISEYERRFSYDQVTYRGQTHRVSDWLPKNGFFSTYVMKPGAEEITDVRALRSRRLRAPDGKTYLWKSRSGEKFKLVDAHSDSVVARTRAANVGLFSAKHNIIIEAGPEVVAFLDLIVLSFLICEHERQARQESE